MSNLGKSTIEGQGKNFDASKLDTTIDLINSTYNVDAVSYCSSISNNFADISRIVVSEDSNLSDACSRVSVILNDIKIELTNTVNEITKELEKYAEETLENESGVTVNLNNINSEIDNIKNLLSEI